LMCFGRRDSQRKANCFGDDTPWARRVIMWFSNFQHQCSTDDFTKVTCLFLGSVNCRHHLWLWSRGLLIGQLL
jgi:hypothetical protein